MALVVASDPLASSPTVRISGVAAINVANVLGRYLWFALRHGTLYSEVQEQVVGARVA